MLTIRGDINSNDDDGSGDDDGDNGLHGTL